MLRQVLTVWPKWPWAGSSSSALSFPSARMAGAGHITLHWCFLSFFLLLFLGTRELPFLNLKWVRSHGRSKTRLATLTCPRVVKTKLWTPGMPHKPASEPSNVCPSIATLSQRNWSTGDQVKVPSWISQIESGRIRLMEAACVQVHTSGPWHGQPAPSCMWQGWLNTARLRTVKVLFTYEYSL